MASNGEGRGSLRRRVARVAREAGAELVAVSYFDYETRTAWSYHGEEWFHAASTIKLPVLVGVFGAIERGELTLDSRVHVRNRFLSAVDGEAFRVGSGRDANGAVYQALGKTLKVEALCFHMITTSSNLATNLLLDVVGLAALQRTLDELRLGGIELRRGVEDERAFEEGINNLVTADGLVRLLRLIEEEKTFSREAAQKMLEILHQQAFNSGIPAGLPDDARVAHKTGEISTVAHDTGLVYLPERKPYALAILTRWDAETTAGRQATVAAISREVYDCLAAGDEEASDE